MAQYKEGWVTVPANQTRSGKPERRWRQPSGTLMEVQPGPGFVATQLGRAFNQLGVLGASAEAALNQAGGYAAQPADTGRYVPGDQQRDFDPGKDQTKKPAAPGLTAPVAYGDPASRAREAEQRRMLQQATPYWEREENKALLQAAQPDGGPRAGEAGYAQRADIQAWIAANQNAPKGADGKNIVDRFLEQQRKRGLLEPEGQSNPSFAIGAERIAAPVDAESAAQAGTRGLVGFDGSAIEQARANVAELQGRESAALTKRVFDMAAKDELPDWITTPVQVPQNVKVAFDQASPLPGAAEAFSGLEIARPFTNPEMNRQFAALGQPAEAQAIATGTGAGPSMQPTSAAAGEVGVEPAQPDAPGNKPNPADDLARRYIDNLRTTRSARLGL